MFGFMGGYLPSQPMQAPLPQMYQPQMQPRQQVIGRWTTARTYADVQQAPIPADGSQTIFMLEQEPAFYLVSMQNGQKMVQGYTFQPMGGNPTERAQEAPKTAHPIDNTPNDFEERIRKLERFSERMQVLIGDDNDGKPDATADRAE